MDLRKIKKLIELVEESGITELEVRDGDEGIRIARAGGPVTAGAAVEAGSAVPEGTPTLPAPAVPAATDGQGAGFEVAAPLSGTFYRAPAPGERPFATVGQEVAMGDVLCIIESMKMMNQIEAEKGGRVTEIHIEDGQPIEAGTLLFRLE